MSAITRYVLLFIIVLNLVTFGLNMSSFTFSRDNPTSNVQIQMNQPKSKESAVLARPIVKDAERPRRLVSPSPTLLSPKSLAENHESKNSNAGSSRVEVKVEVSAQSTIVPQSMVDHTTKLYSSDDRTVLSKSPLVKDNSDQDRASWEDTTTAISNVKPPFAVSEEHRLACVERVMDLKNNDNTSMGTVHARLAEKISLMADIAACGTSRKYVILGRYHFADGNVLFDSYLANHSWTKLDVDIPLSRGNLSYFDVLPSDTTMVLAACKRVLPVLYLKRRGIPLISMAPSERIHVLKIPFFQSVKKLFDQVYKCDYRRFHPESYLIDSSAQCSFIASDVLAESDPKTVWFLKGGMESFGDGIVVRSAQDLLTNELNQANCEARFAPKKRGGVVSKTLLIQRGVDNILEVEGRKTQGRAYFLISAYKPASVWYFMGYFNVAGMSVASLNNTTGVDANVGEGNGGDEEEFRSVHVTNLRTNQNSKRLLFHEFMAGRSREEMERLNKNIKIAALTAYLALKPKLGSSKGSFTLFGFDFLVLSDLSVRVLETNCNCELFVDVGKFGRERVELSKALGKNMMDIVLAENLNPIGFQALMRSYLRSHDMRSTEGFFGDESDDEHKYQTRASFELLYTETVEPPFIFANVPVEMCNRNP